MKEQYYKPETEDLRIGYECEINIITPQPIKEEWKSATIKDGFNVFDFISAISLLQQNKLRTPFLTQKQIESLKWKYIEDDECSDLLKDTNTLLYKMLIFRYKKYELWWIEELKQIHLGILDSDGYFNTLYKGTCKSINEFRYLMKLLNI